MKSHPAFAGENYVVRQDSMAAFVNKHIPVDKNNPVGIIMELFQAMAHVGCTREFPWCRPINWGDGTFEI